MDTTLKETGAKPKKSLIKKKCDFCHKIKANSFFLSDEVLGKKLPVIVEHILDVAIDHKLLTKYLSCTECTISLIQAEDTVLKLRSITAKLKGVKGQKNSKISSKNALLNGDGDTSMQGHSTITKEKQNDISICSEGDDNVEQKSFDPQESSTVKKTKKFDGLLNADANNAELSKIVSGYDSFASKQSESNAIISSTLAADVLGNKDNERDTSPIKKAQKKTTTNKSGAAAASTKKSPKKTSTAKMGEALKVIDQIDLSAGTSAYSGPSPDNDIGQNKINNVDSTTKSSLNKKRKNLNEAQLHGSSPKKALKNAASASFVKFNNPDGDKAKAVTNSVEETEIDNMKKHCKVEDNDAEDGSIEIVEIGNLLDSFNQIPSIDGLTCGLCGKTVNNVDALHRHKQKHHPNAFEKQCPNCNKSFHAQEKYEAHVFSQKCRLAVFGCQFPNCLRRFTKKPKLLEHMAKKHASADD